MYSYFGPVRSDCRGFYRSVLAAKYSRFFGNSCRMKNVSDPTASKHLFKVLLLTLLPHCRVAAMAFQFPTWRNPLFADTQHATGCSWEKATQDIPLGLSSAYVPHSNDARKGLVLEQHCKTNYFPFIRIL